MGEAAAKLGATFADYIACDEASEEKHEFVDGEIFAMSGGTVAHALIGTNVARALGNVLERQPCRVFGSDLRIRVPATGLATYPDVTVVCGKPMLDPENAHTITNPIVLIEVLSPSTEKYNRQQKFDHYRLLPSLREYLLISQDKQHISHYTRNADDSWTLRDIRPPSELRLSSLECTLSLETIYQGVFDL